MCFGSQVPLKLQASAFVNLKWEEWAPEELLKRGNEETMTYHSVCQCQQALGNINQTFSLAPNSAYFSVQKSIFLPIWKTVEETYSFSYRRKHTR